MPSSCAMNLRLRYMFYFWWGEKKNRRACPAQPHPWVLIFNEHVQQYQSKNETCGHAYTEMLSAWCEQVSVANVNWSIAWVSEPSCLSVQQLTNAFWQSRNHCFWSGGDFCFPSHHQRFTVNKRGTPEACDDKDYWKHTREWVLDKNYGEENI